MVYLVFHHLNQYLAQEMKKMSFASETSKEFAILDTFVIQLNIVDRNAEQSCNWTIFIFSCSPSEKKFPRGCGLGCMFKLM